jgi:uncharacterized protein (DUF302 family)
MTRQKIGFTKIVKDSFENAIPRVVEELKKEGFGVLTEIDVKETLKKKLGVEFRKYRILGACNPPMAHKALSQETDVGLFMPCNVIVYENDQGQTVVTALDPLVALTPLEKPQLSPIAKEGAEKLQKVINAL